MDARSITAAVRSTQPTSAVHHRCCAAALVAAIVQRLSWALDRHGDVMMILLNRLFQSLCSRISFGLVSVVYRYLWLIR